MVLDAGYLVKARMLYQLGGGQVIMAHDGLNLRDLKPAKLIDLPFDEFSSGLIPAHCGSDAT